MHTVVGEDNVGYFLVAEKKVVKFADSVNCMVSCILYGSEISTEAI